MKTEQDPEFVQGGAPGGLVPSQSELPVVPVIGGQPFTTGGYSADPSRVSQVSTSEDPRSLGVSRPPAGVAK